MKQKFIYIVGSMCVIAGLLAPSTTFASDSMSGGAPKSTTTGSAQQTQAQNKQKREERIKLLEQCRAGGKTAREAFRKAMTDAMAAFQTATKLARQKRDADIKTAETTFKTAYAAATTEIAKQAAKDARKTAIEAARKAYKTAGFIG
jgi:hypothetical protein